MEKPASISSSLWSIERSIAQYATVRGPKSSKAEAAPAAGLEDAARKSPPVPAGSKTSSLPETSSVSSSVWVIEKDIAQYSSPMDPVATSGDQSLPETAVPPEGDLEDAKKEQPPMPANLDPLSFPDGGLEAWTVAFGAFCCLFVSFGWINCIGIFQEYYEGHQLSSLSPGTIAWIPSLETFMMFAGGPVFGKIYDNHGPRYLLLFGSFMHVFGLMMTSLSTKYYHFILAQGVCSPIGASAIFYPAISTTSTWFSKRRALAFGIVTSGSSLGGVVLPIMVERLIRQVGFAWAMRIAAFLILALLIIGNLTVKARLAPVKKPFRFMEFLEPFRELPYLLVALGSFMFFFGIFIPFTYVILQALSIGMGPSLALYLISILNAASLFGRILPGYLGDRYGRFNVMILTSYFSAILVLAVWRNAHNNASIIVFAALYGFSSGAFVSISPAVIAQVSDVRQIGIRTGSLFAFISVAALCGSPIGGTLVTHYKGGYEGLQIFAGVTMMAGATFFVAARASVVGLKVLVKV